MDALLSLIIAMLAFALLILLAQRSFKFVILLGCALIALTVLTTLGVIG
ncbi:MAG: hypothetical protein QXJ32_02515 [Thermoplasmata archaeon]